MIDVKGIMDLIPHRFPMLLVDRVLEYEPMKTIVCIKNATINEQFFQGHFPGNPIMPGVLTIEAMAQASAILAFKSLNKSNIPVYFMSIEKAKFRKPIVPGDQIRLECSITQQRGPVWKFSGKALVDGAVAAEADFTAMVDDKEPK